MEPVSLALSAVVLVKPVLKAVQEIYADSRGFGKDAEKLFLRLSVQEVRLESLQRIIFEPGKIPSISGRLFDQLDANFQSHLIRMFRQLYGMLYDFKSGSEKYKADNSSTISATNMPADGAFDEAAAMRLITLGESNEKQFSESTSWTKKARWVMWDKRNAEKMIVEFEAWTDRFRMLLESAWWPMQNFQQIGTIDALEKDNDTIDAGMTSSIEIRKLLLDKASSNAVASSLKISAADFRRSPPLNGIDIGTLNGSNVFAEYRGYELEGNGYVHGETLKNIEQLAALLHQHKDNRFRVSHCIGYFEDRVNKRFAFVFQVPEGSYPRPYSLRLAYDEKALRPSLEHRLRLAHNLAESLMLLHSVGWVHKGLRSENILFFPQNEATKHITEPLICGFEFSRHESAATNLHEDFSVARNIYRHPERWGKPQKRFEMFHDIYALGVILLEIGLWQAVESFEKNAFQNNKSVSPQSIKDRLIKHAEQRLGFYAGDRYKSVVLRCLKSDFGDEGSSTSGETDERLAYIKNVVDVLGSYDTT